jgi:hypothetical protein
MISYYRSEIAEPAAGKNDGDENWDITNKKYRPDKDADDGGHYGKPVGVVTYQDGEFQCRITAQGRDWHFRALELGTLQDQVRRFFGAERGKIVFRLDRAADLARFGEHNAIARL